MASNKYHFLWLVITVILSSVHPEGVSAQDTLKVITINEAISATLNNNKTIRLAQLDESIAASNYKQTEAIFLPQLSFSYTAMTTNNPLNAFGFKLQQKSITQNDFNPDLLNNPSATGDFTTAVQLQQPLLNLDLLYKRKAAANKRNCINIKHNEPKRL